MMKWTLSLFLGLLVSCSHSQQEKTIQTIDSTETTILDSLGLDMEVARDSKYRFQFVATSIKEGKPEKTAFYGTENYYYPASLVKLPTALVLLEELKRLDISLDAFIRFNTDTVETCGSVRFVELTKNQKITFRQMLNELIVVSDNHFYNALYHFITPGSLDARLLELGFEDVYIYKAFTGCDTLQQLTTYPSIVVDVQPRKTTKLELWSRTMHPSRFRNAYTKTENRMFGSKHENEEGEIVDGPYDLNYNLQIPLEQVHEMMLRFFFPNNYPEEEQWNIREEDRNYLMELMGKYPSEIKSVYRNIDHLDDFEYKYVQNTEGIAKGRTFGKLGLSYGFASETVYVPSEGIGNGVLLSYSVYVNSNDIVNDGEYDYETVARPFAEALYARILEWHKK